MDNSAVHDYCPWINIAVGADGRVTITNPAGSVTILKTNEVNINMPAGSFSIITPTTQDYGDYDA